MTVAGIDIGSQATKVVILEGDRILASAILHTGESREREARQAMEEALRQAGLAWEDLTGVVSTGMGRAGASFTQKQRSTESCLAGGACFFYPQARTVLDVGAEISTAIRLSAEGTVEDSVRNDKCAAGTGIFLDTMSLMLRVPLEELGAESLKATNPVTISSKCAVFAESEVVSLAHRAPPVPVADILAGIHGSMVEGLLGLVQRVGVQHEVVMTGGVSQNIGIIRAMEEKLDQHIFVPPEPRIVAALGAALIARQSQAK